MGSNPTLGVMKKLTQEQIDARIEMYEEVIEHLYMNICDTAEEKRQAKVIQNQIRRLSEAFQKKHCQGS